MSFLRQLDILNPAMIVYPITIIGVGGIGGPVAWILAKMGCREITLYDPDLVEEHNLPNQFFRLGDKGRLKVEAVRENILQFAETKITAIPEFFQGQMDLEGIVISGVDSMKSRQDIWAKVRYNLNVPLYLDGRMGGEIVQVFTVRPCQIEDIETYEKNLFSDEEASNLPCTAQSIIYSVMVLGGLIASQLKKWLKGESYRTKITFDLKTMTLLLEGKEVIPMK